MILLYRITVVTSHGSVMWEFDDTYKRESFCNCLDARLQTFSNLSRSLQWVRSQYSETNHAACSENFYGELNAIVRGCGKKVFGTTTHKGRSVPE